MTNKKQSFIVVVPAAGVGKRMQAQCPKQYLTIGGSTILEHTVMRLLSHPAIDQVILAVSQNDGYFVDTPLVNNPKVLRVNGGEERVDSVLAGLEMVDHKQYPWVLVHDAARPCLSHKDLDALIDSCLTTNNGGLLAAPVRDTMKRSNDKQQVETTVDRSTLWHALTPQMYRGEQLINAIKKAQADNVVITDESSAIEYAKYPSLLVEGRSDNIKITRPDDLALATFILAQQNSNNTHLSQEKTCE